MVIGFQERFKQPIIGKTKKHTIREDCHNRWKAGVKMHMATGVRTKNYNQFAEEVCKSTQNIEVRRTSDYLNETLVIVDGRVLSQAEVQQLAFNDGFVNLIDFYLWFSSGFSGKIIHWTELRY